MKKSRMALACAVLAVICAAQTGFAAGELMPFPQGKTFAGCLKPGKGQAALNTDVKNFYTNNYKQYIVGPSSDGQYYITQPMNNLEDDDGVPYSSITTSEAHGYGMMIIALMAGATGEPNAKAIFDGMLKFAQNHPSSLTTNLMNWAPSAVGISNPSNCASDGDLDIAYALMLADKQWGSAGTYNYLSIAKTRCAVIRSKIFDGTTNRITIDDNTDDNGSNTRSSDWILDHIHTFAALDATYKTTYDAVAAEVLNCINGVANGTTGLVPDFVTGNPPTADANAAGTGELNGQYYSYNGCRYPWRIALDYMHFGTAASKTAASKVANWAITATGSNLAQLKSGYQLNGTALVNWGQEREFVAPMVLAVTTTANQSMVDDGWAAVIGSRTIASGGADGVYSNGIALACLLAISGNWWSPANSNPSDPNTVFLTLTASGNNGTITNSAGTTTFNKTQNTSVTLTATPKTGYVFVNWTGDVTGTNATITVVMNANKTITANFASTSPNLVPFMTWEANVDAIGSIVTIDSSKVKTPGTVAATMTTVKNTNYDSYSSLSGYLDTILTGATKISITYTSSKAFWFSLDQTGTDGFGIDMPAASTSATMDISIAGATVDVKKPSWSDNTGTLNLSIISGLSFDPATDADDAAIKAITGSITITSIKITGYIGNATSGIRVKNATTVLSSAARIGIRAGQMRVSVPKTGTYSVELYGIDGRQVRKSSTTLVAGENIVKIRGLSCGQYMVRVRGAAAFNGRVVIGK